MTATVLPPSTITLRIETEMVAPRLRDGVQTVFDIQDKQRDLQPPVLTSNGIAVFEINAALKSGDLAGSFVHGKPGERFLYLGWRPLAGSNDDWIRRWKIRLADLPKHAATAVCHIDATEAGKTWIGTSWQPDTVS
jgi:hypothetical protein